RGRTARSCGSTQLRDEEVARGGAGGHELVRAHELVRDAVREAGAVEHEGVELAVLAARVDSGRKIGDEAAVERAATERRVEKARIHADDAGLIAQREQFIDEVAA